MQLVLLNTLAIWKKLKGSRPVYVINEKISTKQWKEQVISQNMKNGDVVKTLAVELLSMNNNGLVEADFQKVSRRRCFQCRVKFTSENGNIFQKLEERFQHKVKISVSLRNADASKVIVSLKDMEIDREDYVITGVSPTYDDYEEYGICKLLITASISLPEENIIKVSLPPSVPASKKVLEQGIFSDCTILAGDGTRIKCHRAFLYASSPVLKAMFESGMQESQTGQVDMTDVSKDAVKAFLRYLYYDDLNEAKVDMGIAFELMYVGHKYHIPRLEALMILRLLGRKDSDFSEEAALRIYGFVQDIIPAHPLKTKMISILKSKMDELEKLPEYNELFEKNSKAAMNLCKELAKKPH